MIELWFIRHGESKNNEILNRAGGLGALAYPVEFTQDPLLTRRGGLVAAENGQKLADCNITFDLCLTSNMVRTMETAFFMLVKSKLCDEVHVIPHMSEIPVWAGVIPIYENMPLARTRQVEKLGKVHGKELLDSINWDMVGGFDEGNECCAPPNGQLFVDFLYRHAKVQQLLEAKPNKLRIAVVTHSNLLKQILELDSKPSNADIWVAQLKVSQAGFEHGPATEFVSLGPAQPWFQEHIAVQREALAKKIARVASKTERKVFKYETKLFKLRHGLDEDEQGSQRVLKKESRLTLKMERKRKKYERKLDRLTSVMSRTQNQSDKDLMAVREASSGAVGGEDEDKGDFDSSDDSE